MRQESVRSSQGDLGGVMHRVESALRQLPETLRVTDLARETGVSARTLYRAFARHRGAPPITSLRRSRLEGVRRRLRAAAPGDTVTEAALDWGFSHLGRFAQHYARCFGERPSETLRRAREIQEAPSAAQSVA